MSEEQNKISFGITSETKSANSAPFLVATKVENDPKFPSGWKFPICRLVNVIADPNFKKKDESTTPVLQFVFKDSKDRRHIHFEWAQDPNDADFVKKHEGMKVRIKHIYTAVFGSFPDSTGIGADATSYGDFFKAVADAFNSQTIKKGDTNVRAFSQVPLYYKVTYYKNNFGFPLSPNFLERVSEKEPCTLTINKVYDSLEPAGKAKLPGMPGGGSDSPDDLPTFENAYD